MIKVFVLLLLLVFVCRVYKEWFNKGRKGYVDFGINIEIKINDFF